MAPSIPQAKPGDNRGVNLRAIAARANRIVSTSCPSCAIPEDLARSEDSISPFNHCIRGACATPCTANSVSKDHGRPGPFTEPAAVAPRTAWVLARRSACIGRGPAWEMLIAGTLHTA